MRRATRAGPCMRKFPPTTYVALVMVEGIADLLGGKLASSRKGSSHRALEGRLATLAFVRVRLVQRLRMEDPSRPGMVRCASR